MDFANDGDLNAFINYFGSTTHLICNIDGEAPDFGNNWTDFASAFNDLHVDGQGYLANMTYTHNAETLGSVKDIIDRYDYIISKYPSLNDFMNRVDAGTYQQTFNNLSAIHPSTILKDNSSLIFVFSIISISLVITLVLVIKKRKHIFNEK